MRTPTATIAAALAAAALAACSGDDDDASSAPPNVDFAVADLEALSFAPDDLPEMEYQADASGLGVFSAEQRKEAKEEGDEGGAELVEQLEGIGLEEDYQSQFFASSRDAELNFVESIAFLFEDENAAEEAVDVIRRASAENVAPAEQIKAPELGEQAFGVRGEFDDFLVYSFGWRVGDMVQLIGVAPGDQDAGLQSALQLADQLAELAGA